MQTFGRSFHARHGPGSSIEGGIREWRRCNPTAMDKDNPAFDASFDLALQKAESDVKNEEQTDCRGFRVVECRAQGRELRKKMSRNFLVMEGRRVRDFEQIFLLLLVFCAYSSTSLIFLLKSNPSCEVAVNQ